MIRQATVEDASRIAEISIFTKRMNYRRIFNDDKVSFGDMQVYPLAKAYIENPEQLNDFWVFEDEFVKGYIHICGSQIVELYVDSFFENCGIGSKLIDFAIKEYNCDHLWVLEKNDGAKRFYNRKGFSASGQKKLENGTEEFIIEMRRDL
jgi:putative acetyltransferase